MAEKRIIGIDFTNREIRMAQVSVGRGLPRLERFALGPIPEGVFSGGRLAEPAKLAEAIRDLLRGYRFSGRKAILGVSGRYGVTRMITLPKMTASQTRDAINLQLNQYVPFPPADTIYDFKVLRELKEEDQPSQEVLLVATRRSSIQPLMRVMKQAGLTLTGVKITTLASFCLFEDLYKENEQAVAFVDVRDTVTDISFVAEDYFRLSRSIEFGLTSMVDRLRQKMGYSYEEAVEHFYRNKVDLMESYRPSSSTAEEGVVSVAAEGPVDLDRQLGLAKSEETIEKTVRDSVLRAMGQFVNELMRSIRYFESQQKRRSRVGRIVVFGYIGGLSRLGEYLAEQTALEVTVVNDIPGVEVGLDDAEQRELRGKEAVLVVPVGLAVEAIKRRKIDLNLVPRETMYRRKSVGALKFGVILVIILAAILANIYIKLNADLGKLKNSESQLVTQISSIEPYYKQAQEFKDYNTRVESKLKSVVSLAALQPPWPVIMDELGKVMRDKAYIDEMHWDANGATWKIHGFCLGSDEMQKLLVNLYHSDVFDIAEAEDLTSSLKTSDEGTLGGNFGGRSGSGGFGFSEPAPDSGNMVAPVPPGSPGGESLRGRFGDGGPSEMGSRQPIPLYKLPDQGPGMQVIEWYFQGHEFIAPIMWEFTLSGTINPAVMQSGKDLFGPELADLIGGAAAAGNRPAGTPSGGAGIGGNLGGGAAPGTTPGGGAAGDDSGV